MVVVEAEAMSSSMLAEAARETVRFRDLEHRKCLPEHLAPQGSSFHVVCCPGPDQEQRIA
jgi:hypothetical protein